MTRPQDLVEHAIMELIGGKDFDGYLATRLDCKIVNSLPGDIQTAALMYKNGRFFLRFVKTWFEALTDEQRVAVVKHEIGHFVLKHMSRRNGKEPMLFNIAGDMAINQSIQGLPNDCVKVPQGWPNNEPLEVYYDKLVQEARKNSKGGKCGKCNGTGQKPNGQGKCDNCNGTGNTPGGNIPKQFDTVMDAPINGDSDADSMADEILRDVIKERINAGENVERMRGLHAGALEGLIDDLTKPPMLDWRQTLTRFASSLADARTRMTMKRPDRRNLVPFGKKKEYLPALVVCVDTSGSVSDEMLSQFFSQIALLGRMLREVEVVIADAEVHEHFTYHQGMESTLRNAAKGRGGTDFDPAVRYINKNLTHCDGAVYLTDGYCPVPDTKCRLPLIWIVTDNTQFEGRPRIMAEDDGKRRRRGY